VLRRICYDKQMID